eukprot:m.43254 g.43254  ORF g.43254 m.43254 type:complete len:311 (+) comp10545_c0_seq1:36-968(+)
MELHEGDKAVIHFKTVRKADGHVIDSSRAMHLGPLDLRIGKKFLLTQWEEEVASMSVGEMKSVEATPESILNYPQFSRVYRDASRKKHAEEHGEHYHSTLHGCCAHMSENDKDADLYKLGPDTHLLFEFELLSVEKAESYEKELWEMSVEEKVDALPILKEQGNAFFKGTQYEEAEEKYMRALGIIENLNTMKTSHGNIDDETHREVQSQKCVFLSNLCACQLKQKKYVEVIKHASMGIEIDPNHVKLLFRRAKAHYERGRDLDLALADAQNALKKSNNDDKALKKLVTAINSKTKKQEKGDATMYKKMF